MAVTINASLSAGLVQTADTTGDLNLQSGGTTRLAVTSTGVAVTGTLSASGASTFAAGSAAAPSIAPTGDSNTGIFFPAADTIAFSEGGTESMRIDSSGNLMVGSTSSSHALLVKRAASTSDSSTISIVSGTSGYAQLLLGDTDSDARGYVVYQNSNDSLQIASAGAERMRIDSSGNVGIGTTPSYKLHVQASSNDVAVFSRDTGSVLYMYNDKTNVGMFTGANGTVDGIYMDAVNHTGIMYINGAQRFSISSAGVATINNLAGSGSRAVNASAAGALSAASDSSLKQEVTGIPIAGLAEILQLTPRAYKWLDDIAIRGDDAAVELGFFANEVAPIIPSAAPKCEDGLYGFYDRSVTAALVKAIQELKAIVDTQAEQIKALQGAK